MDLSHSQSMEFARDMFMFSFYTRGMSFVDMAFLKKTDLNNGMLTYRRKKTGQLLSIRWEKCMQDIVDKYPGNYSTYLLPIIIHIRKDERLQYKNSICLVNRRLKEIGKKLGLVHPLTMYVARHSWASVARGKHIPLSVISEGMGHDSEKTTLIYLAALDTTVIDKANMVVLREFL
jgi:integrase